MILPLLTGIIVFPAHAGMFRALRDRISGSVSFPRARGDVPFPRQQIHKIKLFSPRTRGCSALEERKERYFRVFPAHAGMFPSLLPPIVELLGFPRARGDVPITAPAVGTAWRFSPRTRGCSESHRCGVALALVFPAHAGMFLTTDGNITHLRGFPRARGDVPKNREPPHSLTLFSPRTRGCSCTDPLVLGPVRVFPAHAGMFPSALAPRWARSGFPRARGDVPRVIRLRDKESPFSPRTRGCSQFRPPNVSPLVVFPAHAGMFLSYSP